MNHKIWATSQRVYTAGTRYVARALIIISRYPNVEMEMYSNYYRQWWRVNFQ